MLAFAIQLILAQAALAGLQKSLHNVVLSSRQWWFLDATYDWPLTKAAQHNP